MTKPSYGQWTALIVAAAFVPVFARICFAADAKPIVFPPLQIFKDLCADASWALDDVSRLAEQRHFALLSSEDLPMPDGNLAHKNMWQAETAVGPTVIIVIAGENKAHVYRLTCSVTAPSEFTDFIQSWVKQSFGNPTLTLNKPQNATEIHWAQTFDEGKIEVTLNTRAPDDKHAMLSITKQIAMTKGAGQI
jgi:hypothetical protein